MVASAAAAHKPPKPDGSFKHINHYTVTNEIGERFGLEKRKENDGIEWAYMAHRYYGRMHVVPMGPLGGWCVALTGKPSLILVHVDEDGLLAKAKLQKWDEIVKINRRELPALQEGYDKGEGPAIVLGNAIDQTEGRRDGLMQLDVQRGDQSSRVMIKVPKRGAFTKTFPDRCRKSAQLQADAARQLAGMQKRNGTWGRPIYTTPLVGLTLLSVNDPKYLPEIKKAVDYLCKVYGGEIKHNYAKTGTWPLTLSIIFLAEYVGATGDAEVLPILQNMSDRLGAEFMTPYGGFGNFSLRGKFDYGTYGRKNFGSTGMMALLGWSLCRKVGLLVNREWEETAYDLVRGKENHKDYVLVDYGGVLRKAKELGAETFPTATLLLYLGTNDRDNQIRERLTDTLSRYYKDFPYIHATPSHGIIFGHWALQRALPKNLQEYHDYQKWYLSLSRMPDGTMQYVTPKRARPVIPGGGGGWRGDTAIGEKELALAHTIVLTGGRERHLMLLGQKRLCWLGNANFNKYRIKISEFRKQRLQDGLAMAKALYQEGKQAAAVKKLETMHAERTTKDSEAAKLLSAIRKNKQWASIEAAIKEKDAMAYYLFASLEDQYHTSNNAFKVRKPYLKYVVDNYPGTEAARLAQQYLDAKQFPLEPTPSAPPQK
jgi:hypothetical protein